MMARFDGYIQEIGVVPNFIYQPFREVIERFDWSLASSDDYSMADSSTLVRIIKGGWDPQFYRFRTHVETINLYLKHQRYPFLDHRRLLCASVASLHPNATLRRHSDNKLYHTLSERIHVPMTHPEHVSYLFYPTNDEEIVFKLKPATIYRFNDKIVHCVKNEGNEIRVNLIIDYILECCYFLPFSELNNTGFN
jgi:hypothetical protein